MKKSKNLYIIKNELFAKRYKDFKKSGLIGFFEFNHDLITNYRIFGRKNHHVFFGYYDLQQLNKESNKILVLQVGKHASPKHSVAKVCYIDLHNGKFHFICNTRAWCWQQGARVRWCDDDQNCILVNNKLRGHFICQKVNIFSRKIINNYPIAFYDINLVSGIGLSLDFSRLQRMRPGYGYSSIKDSSKKETAPKTGIVKYDINSRTKNNIISLYELSKQVDCDISDHHYINHISISPNGDKFIFFHLWAKNGIEMWKMRLLISDMNGNFKELERNDIISHYCWLNNNELMVTKIAMDKEFCFIIYNLITGEKRIIENNFLVQDGHPVLLNNKNTFIVDTYPDETSIQELFISDINNGNKKIKLQRIFSDPRLFIEKRCDLHPRVKNKLLSIDSTFLDGVRKVVVLELKEI